MAVMYKDELKGKQGDASSSKYESFEFSNINLKHGSSNMLIVCIYRKQEVSYNTFWSDLESYLDQISGKTEDLIIVGDFNIWKHQMYLEIKKQKTIDIDECIWTHTNRQIINT